MNDKPPSRPHEYCYECHNLTGKGGAADDSNYTVAGQGPFCDDCWSKRGGAHPLNDGGPAFPLPGFYSDDGPAEYDILPAHGMSLRAYLTAHYGAALISGGDAYSVKGETETSDHFRKVMVDQAIQLADATIAALDAAKVACKESPAP